MSNIPIAPQAFLINTGGRAWWGNRAISLIPCDPAEPEILETETVQETSYQVTEADGAINQFWQSMAVLGGVRDFFIKTPLIEANQPGYNPFTKSVDTSSPIRYEQPFFKQGLYDDQTSQMLIMQYGKRNGEILVIYFKEDVYLNESSVIKYLGEDYIITDFKLEPFGGQNFFNVTCEKHSDQNWWVSYNDTELEGRIFITDGSGLGNVANIYHLDAANARIRVYDPTDTTFLFNFGEDISGFPVGSTYIDADNPKWFNPTTITTVRTELVVYDETWQEDIYFSLDGVVIKCKPHSRRR